MFLQNKCKSMNETNTYEKFRKEIFMDRLQKDLETNPPIFDGIIYLLEIIRKKLGYKGILMSDDISMKALKYDLITNAKKSLAAGCNLVLYCAGDINDNFKLIKSVPYIDKFTSKKTSEIYKILR